MKNLRPVNKNPFYGILSGCLHFGLFISLKVHNDPTMRLSKFFLWIDWLGNEQICLLTDLKNVHLTLGKRTPKKNFAQKTYAIFLGLSSVFQLAKQFFGKNFFRCTFYWDQIYIFEIGMKRWIFDTPFAIYRVFIPEKRQLLLFENLKVKNARNLTIFRKTVF